MRRFRKGVMYSVANLESIWNLVQIEYYRGQEIPYDDWEPQFGINLEFSAN